MADYTDEQIEAHIMRNGAGTIIGTTCLECSRMMDGEKPRVCADCQKEARAERRAAARHGAAGPNDSDE